MEAVDMNAPVAGPPVERDIARDLFRRGLMVSPAFLAFGAIGWGWDGVASVAFALAVVLINFLLAAAVISTAARISASMLMGATLFGFLIRLVLIGVALALVQGASWVEGIPLGISLIVLHLGLLAWETRYVSASLAFPGLKPRVGE